MPYLVNELQRIEKFARNYLEISDMAVILDIPAGVLLEDIVDRNRLDMEVDETTGSVLRNIHWYETN